MIIVQDVFMITPPSQVNKEDVGPKIGAPPSDTPFTLDLSAVVPPKEGQETIVIPSGNTESPPPVPPIPPVSTVIPGGTQFSVPSSDNIVPPLPSQNVSTQGNGNPWPKRIMILSVIILFVIGAAVLGKTFLSTLMAPKEVVINYWGLWEQEGIITPIIREFEAKNPKIKVQYNKQSPKQYNQRLRTAIESGTGPDVFRFHNTWVPMLKNQLAPVPTDVMTPEQFTSTYYPVAKDDLVAGSTIYGIPLMIEGLGLFYNQDIFEAAGITAPPTTWEELLAMVPKIAKPDGNGFVVAGIALGTTSNIENFSDILALMFFQNGANPANLTGKEAEETLSFYRKFATPTDPVYTWNDTMDNSMYAFANGKVAMIFAPSWRAFDIDEMAKQVNPNLRYQIVPVPQLPGNTVTWASYWAEGVSEKSKYKKESWEFMKFLTSKEVMMKLYSQEGNIRRFGEPYSRVDMASLIADAPYVGAYVKQAKDARSFPLASRTFDEGINDKMMKYLEMSISSLSQGSSPQQELETLRKGFSQVLSQYGLVTSAATTTTQ